MSSSHAPDLKNLPLTHPIDVATIKPDGLVVNFEATEQERAGLATLFDIPAVVKLNASFKLTRKGSRVKVRGDVSGIVTRLCVLSVEPFDMDFHEVVSVDYDEPREEDAADRPELPRPHHRRAGEGRHHPGPHLQAGPGGHRVEVGHAHL